MRTTKELSLVPANWNHIEKIKKLIKESGKDVLLIGNGDVIDLNDEKEKAQKYGCDGIMIGRGVFGNPFFFSEKKRTELVEEQINKSLDFARDEIDVPSISEKLKILVEHTQIFEKELLLPKHKNFAVMKKHFRAYVNDFPGAKELRVKLMETNNSKEVEKIIRQFLKNN